MSRDGDDGFLALGSGGFGSPGEDGKAFLHRAVVGLEANHAPGEFDQCRPESWVAVFGDAALLAFVSTRILTLRIREDALWAVLRTVYLAPLGSPGQRPV